MSAKIVDGSDDGPAACDPYRANLDRQQYAHDDDGEEVR